MFSTFTGSSRRPRNVNLSGQASNPFTNTSWSPSAVSNATKTITNAQAERGRRQIDRQRLKAASKIQRAWRGHRSRASIREQRRREFDHVYSSSSDSDVGQRIPIAFSLVLAFFTARRGDDLQRLFLFISDCNRVDIQQLDVASRHPSRLQELVVVLVRALDALVSTSTNDASSQLHHLLSLINRLAHHDPRSITKPINQYYTALAKLCRCNEGGEWAEILLKSITTPLKVYPDGGEPSIYKALAFRFLARKDLYLFEHNIKHLAQAVDTKTLAGEIEQEYTSGSENLPPKDELLWLLAHFIDLGRLHRDSTGLVYLKALFIQLSALSSDISARISPQPLSENMGNVAQQSVVQAPALYVSSQLLSLVNHQGISKVVRDFSASLVQASSNREFQGTGLLAGYIMALLQSFPGGADDTRMRLFLEEIPTATARVPIVIYLWQIMQQTLVFQKLKTESEKPVDVLRRYLGSAPPLSAATEDLEWRIILLFLELYIFVLRLSDDDDFVSGIHPAVFDSPASRVRSCSLSLGDLEALTTFLKNTAFTLHYQVQEITQTQEAIDAYRKSRLDSYWNPVQNTPGQSVTPTGLGGGPSLEAATKLDMDSLRGIATTALKMLYDRDSRKHFLSPDHWLMTSTLEKEDFISAVIAEEERQSQEQNDDSDEDFDSTEEPQFGGDFGIHSTFAGQRLSRHARLERLKNRQSRVQKERRLAEMGPKLEVLKHIPFVVPFETRVRIFRQFIQLDRARRVGGNTSLANPFAKHQAKIRRGQLFEDAFEQFYKIGEGLKDAIQITFVDQFDTAEAGIDGGGVTKEFLISVTYEAFGNEHGGSGMFTTSEKSLLYPNPTAVDTLRQSLRERGLDESHPQWREAMSSLLRRFEFLGRIVGKCMYEGILVDLAFAGFFLLKWPSPGPKQENGYKGSVNDLEDMDEELYKGLLRLKNYPGDVSELGLEFTVTDQVSPPGEPIKTITRKLIPNGDQVQVTNDNRLLYISYTARHRLVIQPALQTAAFLRGLRDIIRPSWLSMFNQSELQHLVGGDSSEIDVEDLRRNTVYTGVYEIGDDQQEHPTIKMFWNVMAEFTDAQRRDVLKYVSSTPRAPLLGFSQLKPKFSIRDGGSDEDRLPSTSTCVNLLKLPIYKQESTLREKLLYAVTSGAGFDLS